MEAQKIINGTWGECWLDSEKVGECFALKAEVEFKKEEIKICGQLGTDTKTVGFKCKGSMKLHKINSRIAKKLGEEVKNGKDLRFTILSKLADPDAAGAERVVLKGVNFDNLTLLDWEAGKPGTVDVPFTFTNYEYIDMI